jgi:hypothetical protein
MSTGWIAAQMYVELLSAVAAPKGRDHGAVDVVRQVAGAEVPRGVLDEE